MTVSPSTPQASPLKVGFDVGPLHGHRTGIGAAVAEVTRVLDERPDVTIVPYLVSGRAQPRPGERRLPLPGIVAAHLWSRFSRPLADRWIGDVDVLHGMNFVVPPTRLPTVVTVHDCWFLLHPERASPPVRRSGNWLRRSVAHGAWVHTISEATAERAARALGTDRITVAHLGPPPIIDSEPTQPRGLTQLAPDIVAIGTEERRKGYPDLVRAFGLLAHQVPDVNLVIAGAPGDDSTAIDAAVDALDQATAMRVVRLGIITDAEKAWLLQRARVLAYPSLDEGFGFPLLEANRAGIPIVARAAGSIPEVAGESAITVDDEIDTTQDSFAQRFADALGNVLTDDQLAQQLIAAGPANIDRFSWHQCAAQLTDLYHRAMGEHQ